MKSSSYSLLRLPIIRISALSLAMLSAVLSISAVADTGWPYYGGTQWGERHATLSNINTGNVAQLVPRRVLQLGQMPYLLICMLD
jgi:glucose dehydrogenase